MKSSPLPDLESIQELPKLPGTIPLKATIRGCVVLNTYTLDEPTKDGVAGVVQLAVPDVHGKYHVIETSFQSIWE